MLVCFVQEGLAAPYASSDVVTAFAQEIVKAHEPTNTVSSSFVPGWGSWAGDGCRVPKKFRRKLNKPAKAPLRKLPQVIVTERKNKKLDKHLVSSVYSFLQLCQAILYRYVFASVVVQLTYVHVFICVLRGV